MRLGKVVAGHLVGAKRVAACWICRLQQQCLLLKHHRLVVTALLEVPDRQIVVRDERQWVEIGGHFLSLEILLRKIHCRSEDRLAVQHTVTVGVDLTGAAKSICRRKPIPFGDRNKHQSAERQQVAAVERQRPARSRFRWSEHSTVSIVQREGDQRAAVFGETICVIWRAHGHLFEKICRAAVVGLGIARYEEAALQEKPVTLRVDAAGALSRRRLTQQVAAEGVGDLACDAILHGKNIAQVPIIAPGPDLKASLPIHELHGDADTITGAKHRTLQHGTHVE